MTPKYPFAAVLGQDLVKKGLLACLVNPGIGGILLSGEKGTAKSTIVRSLDGICPDMKVVELPLNATQDRLIGSIDLKAAVCEGKLIFEGGILAAADNNILYVDEVNLLADSLVNDLLAVSSDKWNRVEREGLAYAHPSRFVLIGSMNPEEGKLRSQILDRFGLFVDVKSEKDPYTRAEIMRRRLQYEEDPAAFCGMYREETEKLADSIARAGKICRTFAVSQESMRLACVMASQANTAGQRAEIILVETAKALASLDGRTTISMADLQEAASLALVHRIRSVQPPQASSGESDQDSLPDEPEDGQEDDAQREAGPPQEEQDGGESSSSETENEPEDASPNEEVLREKDRLDEDMKENGEEGEADPDIQLPDEIYEVPRWADPPVLDNRVSGTGRRGRGLSPDKQGRYVKARRRISQDDNDIALDATFRSAAPFQKSRRAAHAGDGPVLLVETEDIRIKKRERRTGCVILFVVDASASIGANRRMSAVKAAVMSLLSFSYVKRDKVGLIAFRGEEARLVVDVTRSVDLASKQLETLACGGRTPLDRGLELAFETMMGYRLRDPGASLTMVLVTDGRANSSGRDGTAPFPSAVKAAKKIAARGFHSIVLDVEEGFIRLHQAQAIAEALNAIHVELDELKSEGILSAVTAFKR